MEDIFIFPKESLTTSRDHSDVVGRGGCGELVRRAYHQRLGTAAVKIFKIAGSVAREAEKRERIKDEVKILISISHENIVRCHGMAMWSHTFAIVMDFVKGGTLSNFVQQPFTTPKFKVLFRMMHELSEALVYLHFTRAGQRIVHGDLKPNNIFLTLDLHIRVGDFGAAALGTITADRTRDQQENSNTVHTPAYTAPEFLFDPFLTKTTAMDVFSLGMNLYEIITGKRPYYEIEEQPRNEVIARAIIANRRPDPTPVQLALNSLQQNENDTYRCAILVAEKMADCWTHSPEQRPKITDIERFLFGVCSNFNPFDVIMQAAQLVSQRQAIHPRFPPEDVVTIDKVAI